MLLRLQLNLKADLNENNHATATIVHPSLLLQMSVVHVCNQSLPLYSADQHSTSTHLPLPLYYSPNCNYQTCAGRGGAVGGVWLLLGY